MLTIVAPSFQDPLSPSLFFLFCLDWVCPFCLHACCPEAKPREAISAAKKGKPNKTKKDKREGEREGGSRNAGATMVQNKYCDLNQSPESVVNYFLLTKLFHCEPLFR